LIFPGRANSIFPGFGPTLVEFCFLQVGTKKRRFFLPNIKRKISNSKIQWGLVSPCTLAMLMCVLSTATYSTFNNSLFVSECVWIKEIETTRNSPTSHELMSVVVHQVISNNVSVVIGPESNVAVERVSQCVGKYFEAHYLALINTNQANGIIA